MNYLAKEIIRDEKIKITSHLNDLGIEKIREEIIEGLNSKQKYISSKFFYDEKGSWLFEEITHLPEYYPTRTEKQILKKIAPELMAQIRQTDIVELGSGDCSKIGILLNSIPKEHFKNINYIPLDVSKSAILKSSKNLSLVFPALAINGLVADFTNQLELIPNNRKRMFCFLGSTIGNFTENVANDFLKNLSHIMNTGDRFLLGVDLVKDEEVLYKAYNDEQNITAQFNLNILEVVNSLIESDFKQNDFDHRAFFNKQESRIEMHLIANKEIVVNSPYFNSQITIAKGENIHTENSYKYTKQRINNLEEISGLTIQNIYTDPNNWFALVHFKK